MDKKLTLGSLFDGIGGFPFAAILSGITPVWASEIEPFCIAVTKERFPDMLHLGSITDINGAEIPPVDIITFGSPCQDLSVAGQRAGLDGARSGLFKEAVRIIYEMREATNGKYPKYIVWENVPGAFSSNKGHDFQTVLEEITKTGIPMPSGGKWSNAGVVRSSGITAAWRLFDAQYWGVPQRRKRIYLIGSFGSDNAVEILFKRDGVRRYLATRGAEEKEIAARPRNNVKGNDTIVFDGQQITSPINRSVPKWNGPCHTLAKGNAHKATVIISAGFNGQNSVTAAGVDYTEEKTPPIIKNKQTDVFCAQVSMIGGANKMLCCLKRAVRRLTPLECERVQGYPDYWTCIQKKETLDGSEFDFWLDVMRKDKEIRGKKRNKHPTSKQLANWYNKLECDGNRYKALGNSLAIPCALFVIGGIAEFERGAL